MANTTVLLQVDEDLKNEATSIFERLGLDLPTAFSMFLKKSVEKRGMPFRVQKQSEKKALKKAKALLKAANKEARKNKIQDMSLEEINAEIRAYREGR